MDSKLAIGFIIANGEDESYEFNSGVFYEIVEKDRAGNLTQYVIYFAQPITEQSSRV